MAELITVEIPDIGDFSDVEVIDVLVAEGEQVKVDDSLLTLESDKASIEVPAPVAGTISRWLIKAGDRVSQGTPALVIEMAAVAEAPPAEEASAPPTLHAPSTNTIAPSNAQYDLVVIGGGPGGYSAAFRAADLGLKVALVERYPTLGGVCLNVGCIPSKALLHVAAVMEETKHFADLGVSYAAPTVDLDRLRAHKEGVVSKLTGGLSQMAKMRKVTVIQGTANFSGSHELTVEGPKSSTVSAKTFIVAVGSQPVKLPFMPDDPRIIDSTGALELADIPKRMLVVGGGIIGLEMATVYANLGTQIDVVEMADGLMAGVDKDLEKVWNKYNQPILSSIMLNTKTVSAEAKPDGIHVQFEGKNAPKDPQIYDKVLVAVGRTPNGAKLSAQLAGVAVSDRGFIEVDSQMRTNVKHIFAIGDVVGQPMLAHKAVHEGHVAAEVIAGELQSNDKLANAAFDPMQIPSVAYTNPEVAWAGKTEAQLKAEGIKYTKGVFPWAASGRAIANGRDEGFTKLMFDDETGRILGGAIVGVSAGDMIGEVCLAIEMGADAIDIGKTIHPHPTLGESLGMAAEVAHGSCTDLPPQRK
ncbi:MAG: dihydrolipoyl dehydrogenase [Gammaproteobacteria bacterium]|nr:dihydrolipoyl dehydrogenase [Gammaproteobacteria bacterium]